MSDPAPLVSGPGRCQATAQLVIKPTQAVLEMGGLSDVLAAAFAAVHHVNRHADRSDFVAVSFPRMWKGRDGMLPGSELVLVGSERSLTNVLLHRGVTVAAKRGMLLNPEVFMVEREAGQVGSAYIRDRTGDRFSSSRVRRMILRASKRGELFELKKPRPRPRPDSMAISYGDVLLQVRRVIAVQGDAPLLVSTYGFSCAGSQAVLPIVADVALEDAVDVAA